MMNQTLLKRLMSIGDVSAITLDQHHDDVINLFAQTDQKAKSIRNQIIHQFEHMYTYLDHDVIVFEHKVYTMNYTSIQDLVHQLNRTLFEHLPKDGCTTCQWHHLLNNHLLFDPEGRYEALRKRFNLTYKDRLMKRIIEHHMIHLSEQPRSIYMSLMEAYRNEKSLDIMRLTPRYLAIIIDIWFSIKKETYASLDDAIDKLSQSHLAIEKNMFSHITKLISMTCNWNEKRLSCMNLAQIIKREVDLLKFE